MQNYLITNNTIAILKKENKTIIYDNKEIKSLNISYKKILDYNCNYYGSSLKGRIDCAKNILNIKYRVPIIIDENNNLIFIQLCSSRNLECLFLNVNKIVDYEEIDNNLLIKCPHNYNFKCSLSKKSLEKLIILSFKLNNTLKSRKLINFV